MAPDQLRFSRSRRLTATSEIERVSRSGSQVRGQFCTARIAHSGRRSGRCAVIVAKHGQTAVLRNRLKRRTREIVRQLILPFIGPLDIVIRMRREAYDAELKMIAADVLRIQNVLRQKGRV